MSQKQKLLAEVESSLKVIKKIREKNTKDKENLKALNNFKIHQSTGGIFDMVGNYLDYIKLTIAVNKEQKMQNKIDAHSNEQAEDVMKSLEKTKKAMNANLETHEGKNEEENRIIRDFVTLEDEEDFNNFNKEYGEEISKNRETPPHFIFDELIDDISSTTDFVEYVEDSGEKKKKKIDLDELNEEENMHESNMQR